MDKHSKDVIEGISKQIRTLFDNSDQAMYAYLDDMNKVCNKKFASLLGYKSPEEWALVKENFPSAFVADESVSTLIGSFRDAIEKNTASAIDITWKKKSGGTIDSSVILVPMVYHDHLYALHFVSKS